MRAIISIIDLLPPGLGSSYGFMRFAKYGICAWVYEDGYMGEPEWINWMRFCTKPKYPGAIGLNWWLAPGVQALGEIVRDPPGKGAGVKFQGIEYNAASGQNMPFQSF